MKKVLYWSIMALPSASFAATDCRYVEYPDHYEAVCTGDTAADTSRATTVNRPMPVARGKHRPPGRYTEAAKAARLDLINPRRDKASDDRHATAQENGK
jgi:hypothetical protein